MAKQLLIDALKGKRTSRAPWLPYAGINSAFLINETADNYLKSPELIAKGVENSAKRYRADGIPLLFDLSVEANAIGCDLRWWPDNVPSVVTHPCSGMESPGKLGLKVPTRESGRWPVVIEAGRLLKPGLDAMDCAMVGLCCGPLTLASHLAGVRIFTDVYKNKEFAREVLEFAGECECRISPVLRGNGMRGHRHCRPRGLPGQIGDIQGVRYSLRTEGIGSHQKGRRVLGIPHLR